MGFNRENRTAAAAVITMAIFNGAFLSLNGLFMLIAPLAWYELVPGVTDTGFFNQHFVRDIGMIQLFLGAAFAIGLAVPERRIGLWAAATVWLSAHALFHFWEVAVGICSPSVIPRDFPAVTMPALFGVVLTLWAIRQSRTEKLAAVSDRPRLQQPEAGA
ncbi:hypothetical protein [Bosea sp. Tri-44]|uniref:hypothetical protein n=1 Tax=Bosea sp. Tri-44 TaxID=1972137 RepID=UPI0020BDA435|nr:hypothetical protein [Bosea sp. Tri-44]